jgi:serine/threonine protein phosphatase PrpC
MSAQHASIASIDHADRCEDATLIYEGDAQTAPVYVVIDGMGGHQYQNDEGEWVTGREAAQMVREVLLEDLARLPHDVSANPGELAEQKATAALVRANKRIYEYLNSQGKRDLTARVGAVATVVIVCEAGQRLLVAQVGDTRAYLLSDGEFFQICEDEDNIAYLVQSGLINDDDAYRITQIINTFDGINEPDAPGTVAIQDQTYDLYIAWRWFWSGNSALGIPGGNVVINALGIQDEDPIPQTSRMEVNPGDILLLASDGIYKNLNEAEITALLPDEDAATKLMEAAYARSQDATNRRATPDDISAIVVRF